MSEGILVLEEVALADLKPHPRNYRSHPEDEIEHLVESIRANGIYRNIVIANEATILAGRGVAIAAGRVGYSKVPEEATQADSTQALQPAHESATSEEES